MKKYLALLMTAALLLSSVCVFTFAAHADGTYSVTLSDLNGFTTDTTTSTDAPVVIADVTAACDAATSNTFIFLAKVVPADDTVIVRNYTLTADGEIKGKAVSANYNGGSNSSTVFVSLDEGHYDEVIIKGTGADGVTYEVVRFTNLTLTAPEHEISEEGFEVVASPVWSMNYTQLEGSGNQVTTTVSDEGYVTYLCGNVGDPYLNYINGSKTVIGRFLLIKYNNHTTIPRMQIYMAQSAGIASDANMIEFEIAANQSGWTYAVVDLSKNGFYDAVEQAVYHFRYDPVEARNWSNGTYTFSGEETIDVAYIHGFTTKAGLQGWLEANELHTVTKTATLVESQLTTIEGKTCYIDKLGDVYEVTDNGDGTFSYTFTAEDVREPVKAVPTTLFDGSRLLGAGTGNNCSFVKDDTTGIVTMTATGADPFYLITDAPFTAARYMTVKYRTTVDDNMEFFTSSDGPGPEGGKSFMTKLTADGQWHTAVIDLSDKSYIDSETYALNFLRFDFLCGATEGTNEVEYIAFFDSEDAAFQYVHTYKTYTVTFTADGKVVAKIAFEAGTTSVTPPAVPEKEGFTAAWAPFEMADKNFTVKAIYTIIDVPTEPETDPVTDPETDPESTPETDPETEAPTEADTDAPGEETTAGETEAVDTSIDPNTTSAADEPSDGTSGCSSVIGCAALVMAAVCAAFALRRKH